MNIKKMIASITTLALMGTTMAVGSVINANADEVIGTAYLSFTNGVAEQWKAGELGEAVEITGNGEYTLSVDLDEGQGAESILLLLISTDINIYEEDGDGNKLYDDMAFTIDSIYVDGNEIAYTGPSDGAVATENDGVSYRLNILNTWGNSVNDIDGNITNSSNVTVNFSVSGLDVDKSGDTTTALVPGASNGENTTTTTEAEKKVDYTLYNDIINKAGNTVSSNGYNTVHNNLGYYLFDINGDGVQELIITDSFESEFSVEDNTEYIWAYYDIYTIKDGKVVEINQDLLEDGQKSLQVAQDTYLSLTVVDGKLAYVAIDPDDTTKAYALVIEGYTELEDGTLSLVASLDSGNASDFTELKLKDFSDKSALDDLSGTKNDNGTKTTTTGTKTDSPATGDAGIGAVAVAFAAAGLSALILKKKD